MRDILRESQDHRNDGQNFYSLTISEIWEHVEITTTKSIRVRNTTSLTIRKVVNKSTVYLEGEPKVNTPI